MEWLETHAKTVGLIVSIVLAAIAWVSGGVTWLLRHERRITEHDERLKMLAVQNTETRDELHEYQTRHDDMTRHDAEQVWKRMDEINAILMKVHTILCEAQRSGRI